MEQDLSLKKPQRDLAKDNLSELDLKELLLQKIRESEGNSEKPSDDSNLETLTIDSMQSADSSAESDPEPFMDDPEIGKTQMPDVSAADDEPLIRTNEDTKASSSMRPIRSVFLQRTL